MTLNVMPPKRIIRILTKSKKEINFKLINFFEGIYLKNYAIIWI